ncbi:MAG: Rne/Rng family ribonuclease [Bacteroidota bacterium]|nr:Rne/Rng family ribonuclease [Bacteroidota bacterium]
MSNELVIDVTASEIVIALLENKQLVELNKEKSNLQFSVGDIYLGKVKKIMPGLNAAFVDVGYEKDAFLHYLDLGPQFQSLNKYLKTALNKKGKIIPLSKFKNEPDIDKNGKISDVLTSGQVVMVQIAKEPISTKGPRLGSEISIAGRHLVLIPFSDKVSVSQKIVSQEERSRLKKLIQSIKPKNYGVIVRTVAEGKKVAVLDEELSSLVKKWETAFESLKGINPPKLIIGELSRTSAILRDMLNGTFSSVTVNDENICNEIKDYVGTIAPEKEKIVKLHTGSVSIFEKFGIDKQIKTLFGKTVSFKNGAYLIIEHTEALHVIDVNSGNRSKTGADQETNAVEVNVSAASEIARQLRLRDMGGIIVVDFIDLHEQEHKQLVFEKMKEVMALDRAKHNILPLSKFGLMQITRQRVRPELSVETLERCPTCRGTGEISPNIVFEEEIFNNISYLATNQTLRSITIKVHPYVASYLLRGFPSKRLQWSLKLKCWVRIIAVPSYTYLERHFFYKDGEEIL